MAKFVCKVCGYVYEGDAAPETCPLCGAPAEMFEKQEEGATNALSLIHIQMCIRDSIKFVGTGEKLEDLEVFHPERMASRILGMGDVLTLIERAQNEVDEKQALEMAKKLKENSFDMNDLLDNLMKIQKMGPLKQVLGMLPGVGKQLENVDIDERQMDHTAAIIYSMTPEERAKPSIINPKRKIRIANGSGMKVEDVNRLLKQFDQMQKMMKQLGGGKKGKRLSLIHIQRTTLA